MSLLPFANSIPTFFGSNQVNGSKKHKHATNQAYMKTLDLNWETCNETKRGSWET